MVFIARYTTPRSGYCSKSLTKMKPGTTQPRNCTQRLFTEDFRLVAPIWFSTRRSHHQRDTGTINNLMFSRRACLFVSCRHRRVHNSILRDCNCDRSSLSSTKTSRAIKAFQSLEMGYLSTHSYMHSFDCDSGGLLQLFTKLLWLMARDLCDSRHLDVSSTFALSRRGFDEC